MVDTVDEVTLNQTAGISDESQKKDLRRRITVVLILLAVLFLLLLYLLLPRFRPITEGIRPLFSIYRLAGPMGVSVDGGGNIYVSETSGKRVLMFNSGGELVRRVDFEKGPGQTQAPYGSALDDERQRFYLADFNFRTVAVYSTKDDGKFLLRFPKNPLSFVFGPGGFVPLDIEYYKDKIYVTSQNGIYIFNSKGILLEIWGGQRSGEIGRFDFPNGIAVDKENGDVYVTDSLSRRVVALTSKGEIRWVIGKPDENGKLRSYFGLPRGITIDEEGRIWVSDTLSHRLVVLDRNGDLVSIIGERGVQDGSFNFPEGMAVSGDRLVLADRANNRVQILEYSTELPRIRVGESNKMRQSRQLPKDGQRFLGKVKSVKLIDGKKPRGDQKL